AGVHFLGDRVGRRSKRRLVAALASDLRIARFPFSRLKGAPSPMGHEFAARRPDAPIDELLSRRAALARTTCGFGAVALAGLLAEQARASGDPLAARPPHHAPRAKRVIFLFMQGGPSHVDSFDYKPLLAEQDGKQRSFADARVIANTGQRES